MQKIIQRFWLTGFFLLFTLASFTWAMIGLRDLLVVLQSLAW
jgi:hypothetical protein